MGGFFDRHAEAYQALPAGNEPYHDVIARRLAEGLHGRVLSVGGLWIGARLHQARCRVTLADLSQGMLRRDLAAGIPGLVCDAGRLALVDSSVDHVVMPLLLHHLTGGGLARARQRVRTALAEARRVTRPGGRLWLNEFCVPRPVYAAQALAAPLTRALLALAGQPMVVMHSRAFYRQALRATGWDDVRVEAVQAPGAGRLDLVRPVIALPWLRVPRFLYPLRPTLVTARRPG